MTERTALQRLRDACGRHEHALIAAWLVGVVAVFAGLGLWGVLLGGAEDVARALDERWVERVERGEELVRQERWEEAEAYLERLDREFPARLSIHKYDRERERVLVALAAAYRAKDRKGRCLDTLRGLVAFDPLNWANHAALAEACEHFGEGGEAAAAWDRVLALQPANAAAARARILAEAEAGDYAAVPPLYGAYLDAYLLAPLAVELDGTSATLEVPVDGRFHEVDAPLPPGTAAPGDAEQQVEAGLELALDTAGFSVELDWIELVPARAVGSARAATPVRWHAPLPPPGAGGVAGESDGPAGGAGLEGLDALGAGRHAARGPRTRLRTRLPFEASPARVRVRLRLFKPLDAELWAAVDRSYRNALDLAGLREARDRSVVGGDAAAIAALAE